MKTPSVLAFGEILFDVFDGVEHIGGAPFNFAAHAAQCGLESSLYSAVGFDDRGRRSLAQLDHFRVRKDWVQTADAYPTGWVDVFLQDGQPSYTITEDVAWDHIQAPSDSDAEALRSSHFDALYFGTLAQRSEKSHAALKSLRETLRGVPVFYDVNLREPFTTMEMVIDSLPGTAIVKLNEEEAALLMRHLWKKQLTPGALYARLVKSFGIHILLLTRGAHGCQVVSRDGLSEVPGETVQVVSAVGAGDAFAATFLAGHLQGLSAGEAARKANRVGAWVASQAETVPVGCPVG